MARVSDLYTGQVKIDSNTNCAKENHKRKMFRFSNCDKKENVKILDPICSHSGAQALEPPCIIALFQCFSPQSPTLPLSTSSIGAAYKGFLEGDSLSPSKKPLISVIDVDEDLNSEKNFCCNHHPQERVSHNNILMGAKITELVISINIII